MVPHNRKKGAANSNIWRIDQAHKPAFEEAESTIGIRGQHEELKSWEWVMHAVASGKKEELQREFIELFIGFVLKMRIYLNFKINMIWWMPYLFKIE